MEVTLRFRPVLAALVALVILPPAVAAASPLNGPSGRHHLSVTGGYAHRLGRIGLGPQLMGLDARPARSHLRDALDVGVGYRVSLRPGVDLALEAHRVEGMGSAPLNRTDWWGLGMRRTFTSDGFRPFFQLGLVHATEFDRRGDGWAPGSSDLGFAVTTGGEVALGSSLSLPIEVGLMFARPEEDVSTLGLRTGVSWHGGR